MKILVVQTDNRDLPFIEASKQINRLAAAQIGAEYFFENIDVYKKSLPGIKEQTLKIFLLKEIIARRPGDVVVFLDTDAWIQNADGLLKVVSKLQDSADKQGCYSRDPFFQVNTFINSGSFIIKCNEYTANMYEKILAAMIENQEVLNVWPYDQKYISDFVFDNKDDFYIFSPEVLNTPAGRVLRHNWKKNQRMISDMMAILQGNRQEESIDIEELMALELDNYPFPNPDDSGNDYKD